MQMPDGPSRLRMCSQGWSGSIESWPVTKSDHEDLRVPGSALAPSGTGFQSHWEPGVRGPRREREDRPERNDGPEPEFAPAFLTRDDD